VIVHEGRIKKRKIAVYRAALKEYTRERVPLDWAMTQVNLGNARRGSRERASRENQGSGHGAHDGSFKVDEIDVGPSDRRFAAELARGCAWPIF
jgi:hypothetical protein